MSASIRPSWSCMRRRCSPRSPTKRPFCSSSDWSFSSSALFSSKRYWASSQTASASLPREASRAWSSCSRRRSSTAELNLEPLEFLLELAGALSLVHLALERAQLAGDLAREHLGAREVLVHRDELLLAALLAAAVLGDVGRLLDEGRAAPPGRLERMESSLPWEMIECVSLPRPESCRMSWTSMRRLGAPLIRYSDVAGAVHPPRDAHLGKVDGQRAVGVVQHERDLGHAHRRARRGAREDHVLHGLAAQLLGTLLAQDPEYRVGDVGLAGAVGAPPPR